jgi:glycogen debranching enzyme
MARIEVRPDLRYAWHGPSLLVTTPRGDCGDAAPLSGYWYRETRHLRTLRLEVNGAAPWLTESASDGSRRLDCSFIHPELTRFGGGGTGAADGDDATDPSGLPFRALDLRLTMCVEIGALELVLTVANRSRAAVRCELAWKLGADFVDLVDANNRERHAAPPCRVEAGPGELRFASDDPTLPVATVVRAEGTVAWSARDGGLTARLRLDAGEQTTATLHIEPVDPARDAESEAAREQAWRRWRDALTRIETRGDPSVTRVIQRNTSDLASLPLLEGAEDEWLVPQAGIPHYPALFGRDAVTAGWQSALLDRGDLLDAVLTCLGRRQGTRSDATRAEQPGRMLQQARSGPLSRLGVLPYARFYADYASPLAYVIALAHLYAWSGNRAALARHWDAARRALDWARHYGDLDGDGFLEYPATRTEGPRNEGWRDSADAIVDDLGETVRGPIATSELQGYWFAAQQLMAVLCWVQGARDDASAYWRAANELRARFNRDFWMEDEGFVGLALDGEKRLVRSLTSNAAHCLTAGILTGDHLQRVVGRLFEPDLFSGWGIRTLSSRHGAYDPVSYHRGSVWAVENATLVFGLRRFGFNARAIELSRALFDLADLYHDARIPEAVGGQARHEWPTPGAYPRANTPQLWNASAFPLVIHSLLGLQPVAPLDLLVVDPMLPDWLPEVILHGLRLGGATATVRFWRDHDGESHAEIVHKRGTLHLIRQPPPEALHVRIRDRFSALADRVLHP